MSKPSKKPPSRNFTDTLALTLTIQTDPLQVPLSVLSCSGRSNPSSFTPVPLTGHSQEVTIRSHATDILHLLASAHVRSSGYAVASDETGAEATEDPRNQPAI